MTVLVKFVNISGLCECKYGEGEGNAAMRYSGSTRSLCGVYINILALKEKNNNKRRISVSHFNDHCLNMSVQLRAGYWWEK